MLKNLSYWYASKNKKQRNILRLAAFIACICVGPFSLVFVATWMVPLMLYLEFQSASSENDQIEKPADE